MNITERLAHYRQHAKPDEAHPNEAQTIRLLHEACRQLDQWEAGRRPDSTTAIEVHPGKPHLGVLVLSKNQQEKNN